MENIEEVSFLGFRGEASLTIVISWCALLGQLRAQNFNLFDRRDQRFGCRTIPMLLPPLSCVNALNTPNVVGPQS